MIPLQSLSSSTKQSSNTKSVRFYFPLHNVLCVGVQALTISMGSQWLDLFESFLLGKCYAISNCSVHFCFAINTCVCVEDCIPYLVSSSTSAVTQRYYRLLEVLRFFSSPSSLFCLSHFESSSSFLKDKAKLKKAAELYLGGGDYFALLEILSQVEGLGTIFMRSARAKSCRDKIPLR